MIKKTFLQRTLALFCTFALFFCLIACDDGHTVPSETSSEEASASRESESASETEEITEKTKRIAFTFDDGPHPTYTKQIVDCAAALGGRVTFFIVGTMLFDESAAENFVYATEAGCEVGVHSFTHTVNYDECDEETYLFELSRTVEVAKELLPSFEPTLMRPVGGRISEEHVKITPYAVVKWSVDTRDWELKAMTSASEQEENVDKIVENILENVSDGAIILMHDLYENSALAFERAARALVEDGYQLVTVSELLGEDVRAGVVYSKGLPATAEANRSEKDEEN